jgi:hypothetical protein
MLLITCEAQLCLWMAVGCAGEIEVGMKKRIVTFGEIMLRLAPPGFQRFTQAHSFEAVYGGGEANVAVSLANFGEDVEFVTRLPKNDLGDACLMSLRGYGIRTEHIARGGERIGIYFLETGAAQRGTKSSMTAPIQVSPPSKRGPLIGRKSSKTRTGSTGQASHLLFRKARRMSAAKPFKLRVKWGSLFRPT